MSSQYNAFAKEFDKTRTRPWPEFAWLQPHVRPHDRVLDIGCGNGRLRDYLPKTVRYTGMDISQDLLQIAKEKHPNDHFIEGNMVADWPLLPNSFDVVTGIASVHHATNRRDQQQIFHEAYKVLKPGGTIFFTTWKLPKKHFWQNILRGRWHVWNVPFQGHPRWYARMSDRRLRHMASAAGFQVQCGFCYHERNYVIIAHKPQ